MRGLGDVLITYDPNVRPGLLADPGHGRRVVERAIGLAHLVKASTDDIAWLYPDLTPAEVARHWLALGASGVVITSSADGADAYTAQGWSVRRPALDVDVIDTVGAGDSFTAGLIGSLLSRGQHTPADPTPRPSGRGPWTPASWWHRSTASGGATIRRPPPTWPRAGSGSSRSE